MNFLENFFRHHRLPQADVQKSNRLPQADVQESNVGQGYPSPELSQYWELPQAELKWKAAKLIRFYEGWFQERLGFSEGVRRYNKHKESGSRHREDSTIRFDILDFRVAVTSTREMFTGDPWTNLAVRIRPLEGAFPIEEDFDHHGSYWENQRDYKQGSFSSYWQHTGEINNYPWIPGHRATNWFVYTSSNVLVPEGDRNVPFLPNRTENSAAAVKGLKEMYAMLKRRR